MLAWIFWFSRFLPRIHLQWTTWASAWCWEPRSGSAQSKSWVWNRKGLWFEAIFVPTWRAASHAGRCESFHSSRPNLEMNLMNMNCKYGSSVGPGLWSQIFSQSWSIRWRSAHVMRIILFTSYIGRLAKWRKHSKVQDHPLTLRQFVLLPMQRWRRPVLKMFAISAIRL